MSRTFLQGAIAWRGRALSGRELLAVGVGGEEDVHRADDAGLVELEEVDGDRQSADLALGFGDDATPAYR
jgi:hypothetical protein